MKYFKTTALPLFLFLVSLPVTLFAIDPNDTRMLSQPTINAGLVAFIYDVELERAYKDFVQSRLLTI